MADGNHAVIRDPERGGCVHRFCCGLWRRDNQELLQKLLILLLDLGCSDMGDEGAGQLVLGQFPLLTFLNLENSRIGAERKEQLRVSAPTGLQIRHPQIKKPVPLVEVGSLPVSKACCATIRREGRGGHGRPGAASPSRTRACHLARGRSLWWLIFHRSILSKMRGFRLKVLLCYINLMRIYCRSQSSRM